MQSNRGQAQRLSRSVGLLITMLVRYPEIGNIHYEPQGEILRIRFLIAGDAAADQGGELTGVVRESLTILVELSGLQPALLEVSSRHEHEGLSVLEVCRDVGTLTQEEVSLLVSLLRDRLGERLVVDHGDLLLEEEAMAQEELIEDLLADLKKGQDVRNLIALREDGRVMVFNK